VPKSTDTGQMTTADSAARLHALEPWIAIADRMDLLDLALQLHKAQEDPQADRVDIARLHLLSGNLDAARALLPEPPQGWTAPSDVHFQPEDMLAAACAAAAGNMVASNWLMAASAVLAERGNPWFGHYLVAVAADARGDKALAAQAWSTLVTRFKFSTELTIPKWAVAQVGHRERLDSTAALMNVATAAFAFKLLPHPVDRHAQPVLDAAKDLVSAGDEAGARLLLELVVRIQPHSPRVVDALTRALRCAVTDGESEPS
jgi:hypothetical protein